MAADDDMIIKNPFQFELHTVVVNDSVKRDAITREQERKFLSSLRTIRITVSSMMQFLSSLRRTVYQ